MTGDGRTVEQLTRLGLTSYEAKAYLALLGRDSFTAAQVARQSGLPRQRIYDVLGSLLQKGLASARPGEVVKYSATAPELAIERLLTHHRQELEDLEREAGNMIETLSPAFRAGREHTDPLEYIEVLRDRRAIQERFDELQRGVKREMLLFTKPPYAQPLEDNVTGLEVSRTHEARSIYEFSVFEDPGMVEAVRRFLEAGEKARFVPELPLKLLIIDESVVMFALQDPVHGSSDLTMMVVEHPALAQVLKIAFDAVWSQGMTFEQAERHVQRRPRTAA